MFECIILVFDTQFLVFDTKFLVFNTQFIIFTHPFIWPTVFVSVIKSSGFTAMLKAPLMLIMTSSPLCMNVPTPKFETHALRELPVRQNRPKLVANRRKTVVKQS